MRTAALVGCALGLLGGCGGSRETVASRPAAPPQASAALSASPPPAAASAAVSAQPAAEPSLCQPPKPRQRRQASVPDAADEPPEYVVVPSLMDMAMLQQRFDEEQACVARPTSVCPAVLQRFARQLRHLPDVADAGAGGWEPGEWNYCWPMKDGAWAVAPVGLRAVTKNDWTTIVGRWAVAHVDRNGKLTKGPSFKFEADPMSGRGFGVVLFDLDNDGRDELVLTEGWGGHTGTGWADGNVWTFKGGKVQKLPVPFRRVVEAHDLDGDGRPELISDAGFEGDIGASICADSAQIHTSTTGPYLVGHASPDGTIRADDRFAELVARTQCPAPPELVFTHGDHEARREALMRIRCARLWGVPTADILRAVGAVCLRPLNHRRGESCYDPPPGACPELEVMRRWASVMPPLTLRGSVVCRPGMQSTQGRCCWPGQTWSVGERSCQGAPSSCPSGYSVGQAECLPDMPMREVTGAAQPFWIDATEVSTAMYARCVAAGACDGPTGVDYDYPVGQDEPMSGVTWQQADAYCRWQSKRLPTAAEWQLAALGTDGRKFPWGSDLTPDRFCWGPEQLCPVGSRAAGASPFGVLGLAGNVSEWTADYVDQPKEDCVLRSYVVRGASIADLPGCSLMNKSETVPGYSTDPARGFRCARSQRP